MDGKADAIAEKNNGVDSPVPTHEVKHFRIARCQVHEVLEGCRSEVEKREPIVTNIVAVGEMPS